MGRAASGAEPDRLGLRGIRATGHHGVLEHERREGQEFIVDAVLGVDTQQAAVHDDLSMTVDYGRLASQIKAAIESDPVDLIETLARRIADLCLGVPLVQWAEVTVHKPQAPIEVPFDDVSLTIFRSRQ